MKLFGRNDELDAADAVHHGTVVRTRPESRVNEQCAKLREVHVELDEIEQRIASLREHQAVFLLKASAPKQRSGTVESIDLRTLADVDVTHAQLDSVSDDIDPSSDFDQRFAAFADVRDEDQSRRWLDTD